METEVLAKRVRPFWGRVAVIESPVDEEQRESGLILPLSDKTDDSVKRGVVVAVDEYWDDDNSKREYEKIAVGTVVYYEGGRRIRDVTVLRIDQIVAFEADE